MSININTLSTALRNLPRPTYKGERYRIAIINRVAELNLIYLGDEKPGDVPYSVREYMLVAVRYCRSPNDCWLEWELDL